MKTELLCALLVLPRALAAVPDSKELKGELAPPRDQGDRNTCGLFAITAIAEYEYGRTTGRKQVKFSEEYLVWAANAATGLSGDQAMFYEAVHGLNALGICDADLMPYGAATGAPQAKAREDAVQRALGWNVHWIRRWDTTEALGSDGIEAIKNAIADGHPVACGLRWPKSLRGSTIANVPSSDAVFDGHSVVLTGYREARPGSGSFTFRNSLGPRWGERGYGTISFAYVRAYANDALWLTYEPRSQVPLHRIECESMRLVSPDVCPAAPQLMQAFGGGMWSEGAQLLCRCVEGSRIELGFSAARDGGFRLRLQATAAPDFGIIQVVVNGTAVASPFDLFSGRVSPSGPLDLGVHELVTGENIIQLATLRKNPNSTGNYFGIDSLELLAP